MTEKAKVVVAAEAITVVGEVKGGELKKPEEKVVAVAPAANATAAAVPPTALKKKPEGNVGLLDDDIFGDLENAAEDEGIESSILDEDVEEIAGSEDVVVEDAEAGEPGLGEDEEELPGTFVIAYSKCLRCTHLCPELNDESNPKGKEYKTCHYSKGNESCPARWATIVVGIPVDRIVEEVLAAEESGDSERLSAIYSKLATKDEAQQAEVHQKLAAARKAEKKKKVAEVEEA